nr:sodium:proton antiporter [Azospirillum argentinense]
MMTDARPNRHLTRSLAALAGLAAAGLPGLALAAEAAGAPHLDGRDLNVFWVIPFVGILLSIALMPLLAPSFWHHHFGKVAAGWAIAFLLPFALTFGRGSPPTSCCTRCFSNTSPSSCC